MAKAANWEGIFPAVTTKFREDGSIDHAEMARCYQLNIDAGIDGLVVCGSLGEASTLTQDEKLDILAVARSVAGNRPVLLTISDGATRDAQRLAERGAAAGAAGFMVLPGLPTIFAGSPTSSTCSGTGTGSLPAWIISPSKASRWERMAGLPESGWPSPGKTWLSGNCTRLVASRKLGRSIDG